MSSDKTNETRRNVLKMVGSSALATTAFAGVSGAVDPSQVPDAEDRIEPDLVVDDLSEYKTQNCEDCTTEGDCRDEACGNHPRTYYERECCQCGGDDICGSWQETSTCCL